MNKFTKRLLALGIALSIVVGVGSVSVFAKTSRASAMVNGATAIGESSISYSTASASTTYYSAGSMSVNSTYTCVNVNTLYVRNINKNSTAYVPVSVNFKAPAKYKSVAIKSNHRVSFQINNWSASTRAEY